MRTLTTDGAAWSLPVSHNSEAQAVSRSVHSLSPQKRLNRSWCRSECWLEWAQGTVIRRGPDPHTWRGNFEGEGGGLRHRPTKRSIGLYSKWLSRAQNRDGAHADWVY